MVTGLEEKLEFPRAVTVLEPESLPEQLRILLMCFA